MDTFSNLGRKIHCSTVRRVRFHLLCLRYSGSTVWPHTFISPSVDPRRAVVSYWRKCVHQVLVHCLGGPCLSRKSVVRLTDSADMTLAVYRGCKQFFSLSMFKFVEFLLNFI